MPLEGHPTYPMIGQKSVLAPHSSSKPSATHPSGKTRDAMTLRVLFAAAALRARIGAGSPKSAGARPPGTSGNRHVTMSINPNANMQFPDGGHCRQLGTLRTSTVPNRTPFDWRLIDRRTGKRALRSSDRGRRHPRPRHGPGIPPSRARTQGRGTGEGAGARASSDRPQQRGDPYRRLLSSGEPQGAPVRRGTRRSPALLRLQGHPLFPPRES